MANKYNEIRKKFESLPPDERRDFTAFVKSSSNARSYTINKLVAAKEKDGVECPHCGHTRAVKFGIRRGIQWYRCKNKKCERTFSGVTNTFLSSTKKDFRVWKKFFKCMMDGFRIRKTAEICRISIKTAFVWRHKILDALAKYQETKRLKGIIETDDTFFPLSYKGGKLPKGRKAHKRGTPAPKKGISKEKVCVSCAIDRRKRIYSKVTALACPSARALRKAFDKIFVNKSSTVICSDRDKAYASFIAKKGFNHIQLEDGLAQQGEYHVQNINSYHSGLKRFLRLFNGVSTKYLNNYLVWYNVIEAKQKSRVVLLKLSIKYVSSTRWDNVSDRRAIPILK